MDPTKNRVYSCCKVYWKMSRFKNWLTYNEWGNTILIEYIQIQIPKLCYFVNPSSLVIGMAK